MSFFPFSQYTYNSNLIYLIREKEVDLKGYKLEILPEKNRFILEGSTPSARYLVLIIKDQIQFSLWQRALKAHLIYANSVTPTPIAESEVVVTTTAEQA